MSLLVTGSIGIDDVETPFGRVEAVLGGSAVYFSYAATLYSPVRLVGVVGEDFPDGFREVFTARPIDIAGLELRKGSKTFRWAGRYTGDMSAAQTLRTDLNVLGEHGPRIPESFRDSRYVFLANTHPALQRELLAQLSAPRLVVCDTMNLWIETTRAALFETLRVVHGLVINDGEARMLTGQNNLVRAGRAILDLGPRFVIIKKGEHGAMYVSRDGLFVVPAFPTDRVKDPTGAGDSFAGGVMGWLAAHDDLSLSTMRAALVRGTVAASFAIEGFSLEAVRELTREQVEDRVQTYLEMMRLA